MMKIYKSMSIVLGLVSLAGCSKQEYTMVEQQNPGSFTIQVSMPQGSPTRVAVSQKPDSRDLFPVWKEGDVMKFYTYDTNGENGSIRIFHVGSSAVENISEDGTVGSFSITYPADANFDPWETFSLVGICGKDSKVDGRDIQVEASAYRANISDFRAPVWFIEKEVGTQSVVSSCKHFGAYEVLHITNTSDLSISLKFKGYEADKLWYRNKSTFLPINLDYLDEKIVSSIENTEPPMQYLFPGETAVFVSWYTPLDVKLKDVTLVVEINGNEVRTPNKKSSDVKMQVGHAYHLYATWDGTHFKFDNGASSTTDDGELDDVPGYEL